MRLRKSNAILREAVRPPASGMLSRGAGRGMGGEIRRKKQMRFDRNRRNSTGNSIISRLSAPCPLVLSTRRHPAEPHLFFLDLHPAHPNAPHPGKHPGRRRHLRYEKARLLILGGIGREGGEAARKENKQGSRYVQSNRRNAGKHI